MALGSRQRICLQLYYCTYFSSFVIYIEHSLVIDAKQSACKLLPWNKQRTCFHWDLHGFIKEKGRNSDRLHQVYYMYCTRMELFAL